jgi:hypothetical protein
MNSRTRPLWIVLGCLVILFTVAVTTFGVNAYRAGMLVVRVQETGPHGTDLAIRIPAILVPIALRAVPDAPLRNAAREAASWTPAIHAVAKALADSPDFLLVRVDSPHETVDIRKHDRKLVVDVTSIEEKVYVSLPIGILTAVVKRLEGVDLSS